MRIQPRRAAFSEDCPIVAKPELGSKRHCLNCGAKFFDLNKDPILCPKCGAVFIAAPLPRSQPRPQPQAEEVEAESPAAELVPLEEADAPDEKVVTAEDEVEIEDEPAADDSFLEEEEGDPDDVSGLIDSDLEDDEET
ncbi:MAG TPA: TIGR02300 family protein [Beijerinckiaceae bacterium]|nr:TIGR02300 family protein [Beijerinckiaceae bacterium]